MITQCQGAVNSFLRFHCADESGNGITDACIHLPLFSVEIMGSGYVFFWQRSLDIVAALDIVRDVADLPAVFLDLIEFL